MRRVASDARLREFQGKLRNEVERIGALAANHPYVIYAIRDPTKKDDRRADGYGPPIYVGQTREMKVRANKHMRDGGEGYTSSRFKSGLLKSIMSSWVVPRFELLDAAPTHLTSLIAETVWARRFVWQGYQLANKWDEHRTKEAPDGIRTVPLGRMWNLTVGEAITDEVGLKVQCEMCGIGLTVPLESLRPEARMSSIRSLNLRCSECGQDAALRLLRPDPDLWMWRTYSPAPMKSLASLR